MGTLFGKEATNPNSEMTVPWLFLQAVAKAEERPKASHNLNRSPAKKGKLRMRLESNAWKEHTEGTRLVTVTGPKHRQSLPSHWPSAASRQAPGDCKVRGACGSGGTVGQQVLHSRGATDLTERVASQPQGKGKNRGDMKVGEVTEASLKTRTTNFLLLPSDLFREYAVSAFPENVAKKERDPS